eukprot:TRINITY_DN29410_c0_g1_i2.p1 TRINITY_DN29410_c0_g1~~TRINITY_DN29410_c0_g1_i2.p1  ORF type:complete len:457 (+),score=122.19 TRINITY_DN29410_c0_g1_i2:113-1483(+)
MEILSMEAGASYNSLEELHEIACAEDITDTLDIQEFNNAGDADAGDSVEVVEAALRAGESLKRFRLRGSPPLIYAAVVQDEELALDIIARGVDVNLNERHDYGYTCLHHAIQGGMLQTVEALLAKGAALELETTDIQLQRCPVQSGGQRALHVAAAAGNAKVLDVLLRARAQVDALDWDGNDALYHCLLKERSDCVKLLLEAARLRPRREDHATGALQQVAWNEGEGCAPEPSLPSRSWLERRGVESKAAAKRRIEESWAIPDTLQEPDTIDDFLSVEECERLMVAVNAVAAVTGWRTDRHRGVATRDIKSRNVPETDAWLRSVVQERLFPYLSKKHGFETSTFSFKDLFYVYYNKEEEGGQTSCGLHRDGGIVSFMMLLNPAEEFTGGGTYFDHPVNKLYKPGQGDCITFSGKARHCGAPITAGRRMLLVGFLDAGDSDAPGCCRLETHFEQGED